MLEHLRQKIDHSLGSFLEHIRKDYHLHLVNPALYNNIREFSLREGKRIRPLLLILSYQGHLAKGKKTPPSLYHASTCIEFLHNFMLIHDDIIDRSSLRRGKPSMHCLLSGIIPCTDPQKLGTDLAIIAGDIVYALAIDAFLAIKEDAGRKERALKYFIQTAAFTAMGEFVDTLNGIDQLEKVTEKDVFLNYSLKTARYTFVCPLVIGAILAGAPKDEIRRLEKLGLYTGEAFQIQDDIIGIFETEKAIGKSILSDLDEQKKTLLIIHACRTLSGKKRRLFIETFTRPVKTMADLVAIRRMLVEAGSLAYALNAINIRIRKANALLGKLSLKPKYRRLVGQSLFQFFRQAQSIANACQANK